MVLIDGNGRVLQAQLGTSADVLYTDAKTAGLDIAQLDVVPYSGFFSGSVWNGNNFVASQVDYRLKRKNEYPPMSDYLDALVKGDAVAQQAYIDACLAVKAKYPKPI